MHRTAYGTAKPSRTKRGYMLQKECQVSSPGREKTNILGTYLKHDMMCCHTAKFGRLRIRSETGKRGSRIDFSWTWKPNMKKLYAHVARVAMKFSMVGLIPVHTADGTSASKVVPAQSRTRVSTANHSFIRKMGDTEHQKLATLSSNSPRPTGKMRWTTWRAVGPPDSRKGAQQRAKTPKTTPPMLVIVNKLLILCSKVNNRSQANETASSNVRLPDIQIFT